MHGGGGGGTAQKHSVADEIDRRTVLQNADLRDTTGGPDADQVPENPYTGA